MECMPYGQGSVSPSLGRGFFCGWNGGRFCSSIVAFTGRTIVVVVAALGICAGALEGSVFGGAVGGVTAFCGAVRLGVFGDWVCSMVPGTRVAVAFLRGSECPTLTELP